MCSRWTSVRVVNQHSSRWDICKLTWISAFLVCRKFPRNKNYWNVLKLCHCYVMVWQAWLMFAQRNTGNLTLWLLHCSYSECSAHISSCIFLYICEYPTYCFDLNGIHMYIWKQSLPFTMVCDAWEV